MSIIKDQLLLDEGITASDKNAFKGMGEFSIPTLHIDALMIQLKESKKLGTTKNAQVLLLGYNTVIVDITLFLWVYWNLNSVMIKTTQSIYFVTGSTIYGIPNPRD